MTLSLAVLVGAAPLAAYLHIHSVGPVLLTALLLGATVLAAAPAGLLVGRSRFRAVALIGIGSTLLRLVLGSLLGHGPGTVVGALVASLVPVVLALLVRIALLRIGDRTSASGDPDALALKPETSKGEPGLMLRGGLGALIAGGLWGIWTLPVLAARHQLNPHQSGEFAAAQLLAGGIIWATAPVVTGFYPTLARGRDHQAALVGLLATAVVAGIGILGLGLLGPSLMPRLYGSEFHPSALLLFDLGISAAVTTVVGFVCWTAVARRHIVWPVLVGLGAGLVLALVLCTAWAHTALELAACPGIAMVMGSLTAGLAKAVMARRLVPEGEAVHAGESVRA
ncbi:MAG: hypothetical protein WA751_10370 [Candidatus Dormiibacterota bacterium]